MNESTFDKSQAIFTPDNITCDSVKQYFFRQRHMLREIIVTKNTANNHTSAF